MNAASRSLALLLILATPIMPASAQGRGGASAQQNGGAATADDPIIASLGSWDFNHDGVFTCENWKRYMGQLFSRADRKKRGYIDAQEFEAIKAADPMFSTAEFGYFDPKARGA